MSRSSRGPLTKLTVSVPLGLKSRIGNAIDTAALPAVNWTSVVTRALEAHLPHVEALAQGAQDMRQANDGRQLLRKLEHRIKTNTETTEQGQTA